MDERELISLRGDVASLTSMVEELRATVARQQGLLNNFRPEPQFDRLKPDLPGFHLRRYGVGGFNKVIMSAGYAVSVGAHTSVSERTFTISADRYFFAKWDHQGKAWVLSSGNIVHDATAFPASDTRYTILPIAKAAWSTAIEGVATITLYHVGILQAPADVLPTGSENYDVLTYDKTGWSGSLPADRTAGWVADVVRGHV